MIPPDFVVSSFDFHIRHIISLAALCLIALEYVGTCRFEFTHIWSRPVTISKVLFVISRYYELIGKTANYFLIHVILGRSPLGVSAERCAIWYTFLYLQCALMLLILDIILFLRVYALYQKNTFILLLVPAILSPYACGAYTSWNLVLRRRESFNGLCDVTSFHDLGYARITLGVTLVLTHAAIWLCGYVKRNTGQGRIPVVRLVVHECSWIFSLLVALVAAILPAGISSGVINPYYHFFLPTTLLSAVNCRIIQNMHNLALDAHYRHHPREENDDAFRLTTFIRTDVETDDGTGDSDCRTLHFN